MTSPMPGHEPQPPKRRSHLMDPNAPRPVYDPEAAQKLLRVQRWVGSTLAVTTLLHLSVGIIIAAVFLPDPALSAEIGLNIIAGAFGLMAVAAALAIHGRSLLSWWLLLACIPTAAGLWFTFS